MPHYDYICPNCGELEFWQKMSDPKIKECPWCDSPNIKRLISGGQGVIFKGEGFYETDYKKKDKNDN